MESLTRINTSIKEEEGLCNLESPKLRKFQRGSIAKKIIKIVLKPNLIIGQIPDRILGRKGWKRKKKSGEGKLLCVFLRRDATQAKKGGGERKRRPMDGMNIPPFLVPPLCITFPQGKNALSFSLHILAREKGAK